MAPVGMCCVKGGGVLCALMICVCCTMLIHCDVCAAALVHCWGLVEGCTNGGFLEGAQLVVGWKVHYWGLAGGCTGGG